MHVLNAGGPGFALQHHTGTYMHTYKCKYIQACTHMHIYVQIYIHIYTQIFLKVIIFSIIVCAKDFLKLLYLGVTALYCPENDL